MAIRKQNLFPLPGEAYGIKCRRNLLVGKATIKIQRDLKYPRVEI